MFLAMMAIKAIKKLLSKEPATLWKLPFQVENYTEVLKKFKDYKLHNKIIIQDEYKYILRTFFDFHIKDKHHALVFYSYGKSEAIVLGKVNGRYFNIELPVDDMVCNSDSSFLATYVP